MTTRCNLSCEYCYLGNCIEDTQTIDLEFAQRGIQDFFEASGSYHIRFFGAGEPTLELEKVKTLLHFSKELAGDQLITEIQTNGVFPAKTAEWLAQNIDIIWVSCDGPPSVQNILRKTPNGKGTSTIIERNIATMLSYQAENSVIGIRSTITPMNLYRQKEMVEYFFDMGIKTVFTDPVFPPVKAEIHSADLKLDEDFMMEYAKQFLQAQQFAEEKGLFYSSVLIINFDEPTEYFCRSCLPCPHLTTDGYVSCCDMAFIDNILPELVYGKFDRASGAIDYYPERIAAIQFRKASNLTECQGCDVLYNCAGSCFGEGVNETGRLLGVKKDYCKAIKYLAKHLPLNAGLYPYLHP
jgi:radical SAM protein with 4Fe4S-binding SPASM domain